MATEVVLVIVDPPFGLLGRTSATVVLRRMVQDPTRRDAALLLRGEAGAGKSALLAHARAVADEAGMRVVASRGAPAEQRLPFAGLHQLLVPLMEHAREVPQPRRSDLLTAFGLVDGEMPAPFRVGLAVLDLLAAASAQRDLLALADDLQWFDDASRQVFAFVARRLSGGSAVLLGAVRDVRPDPFPGAGVAELRVPGLARDAASELLSASSPDLGGGSRRLVLRWAQGNPLALLELPRTVELGTPAGDDGWPPLTDRLQRAFGEGLHDLPAATRTWLLAAALQDGAHVGEVSAVASAVDPDADVRSSAPALRAGVVAVRGYEVVFRHPLVRAAVRQRADPHERIAMHQALADQPTVFPEQQIWHRVAATVGPDADLALELHELAVRYGRRGVLDSAVRALAQSAAFTVDEQGRAGRLLDAADAALRLGRVQLVRQLLRQTDHLRLTPGDARRQRLIDWAVHPPSPGDDTGVLDVVDKARRSAAEGDRGTALDLLLLAARSGGAAGRDASCGPQLLAGLEEIGDRADDARCTLVRAFADPLRSGPVVIDAARAAHGRDLDADEAAKLALAATWVHATDVAVPLLERAVSGLRSSGDVLQLAQMLAVRGWAGFFMGSWDRSLADAGEGRRLAREATQPIHAAALDVLDALLRHLRGGKEDVAGPLTAAEQAGLRFGSASVVNVVQLGRGLTAAADGEYDLAFEHLLRVYVPSDPAYHRMHGCAWLTYLVEVAVHAGRVDAAREVLQELQPLMQLTTAGQLRRSLDYARAVLADDTEAEALYQSALSTDLGPWPLDRARLYLAYGTWLRRQRRAAESRQPLRRAREVFDTLGACSWAAQARRELRAAGERSSDPGRLHEQRLTAQELQIARLAAQGLNNREIGQRMRASHRTVGSHLYRIFPKLGITSRQQLAAVLKHIGPVDEVQSSA